MNRSVLRTQEHSSKQLLNYACVYHIKPQLTHCRHSTHARDIQTHTQWHRHTDWLSRTQLFNGHFRGLPESPGNSRRKVNIWGQGTAKCDWVPWQPLTSPWTSVQVSNTGPMCYHVEHSDSWHRTVVPASNQLHPYFKQGDRTPFPKCRDECLHHTALKAYITTAIRLRYDYGTTITRMHSTTMKVIEITVRVRFDCDTTTTRLRQETDVRFLLVSNRVECKQARTIYVVVGL